MKMNVERIAYQEGVLSWRAKWLVNGNWDLRSLVTVLKCAVFLSENWGAANERTLKRARIMIGLIGVLFCRPGPDYIARMIQSDS
jgi:hypothetical protein